MRFQAGELILAAGFSAAQILLLGVDRDTLRLQRQTLVISVVFHHRGASRDIGLASHA